MKYILLPQKTKIMPKEALEEIEKFESINKSPYSSSYYNVIGITWNYKPEESLRISDHWNFMSKGSKHCILAHTEELIQNEWMLAKYIDGKYHVLKEFGESVPGYKFIEISKLELDMLKELYSLGGIVNSKDWYKRYKLRPKLSKEGHIKNKKDLLKYIGKEVLQKFREKNKSVKKIVFLPEKHVKTIEIALRIYIKSVELDELAKSQEGNNELIKKYNAYDLNERVIESFREKYILVLDNDMAVEFNGEE